MQKIELTSKLVLAIIGMASLSAVLIPTYAAPQIKSADIVDGQVMTADLANNAVTSPKIKDGEVKTEDLASGAVVPKVQVVEQNAGSVPPNTVGAAEAKCPAGTIVTGGGFIANQDEAIISNHPDTHSSPPTSWIVGGLNQASVDNTFSAYAICIGASP